MNVTIVCLPFFMLAWANYKLVIKKKNLQKSAGDSERRCKASKTQRHR